jgi:histidine triad (HIT) family protein
MSLAPAARSAADKLQGVTNCALCKRDHPLMTIYEDEHWIVRHSSETNILGYVLLCAKRHFLDISQADDDEIAAYGRALRATMKAIHEVTDCQRVYTFSLGEAVPHYHLHVIPRTESMPKAYRARGIMQYPLAPAVDPSLCEQVCERLRRAVARLCVV